MFFVLFFNSHHLHTLFKTNTHIYNIVISLSTKGRTCIATTNFAFAYLFFFFHKADGALYYPCGAV